MHIRTLLLSVWSENHISKHQVSPWFPPTGITPYYGCGNRILISFSSSLNCNQLTRQKLKGHNTNTLVCICTEIVWWVLFFRPTVWPNFSWVSKIDGNDLQLVPRGNPKQIYDIRIRTQVSFTDEGPRISVNCNRLRNQKSLPPPWLHLVILDLSRNP